MCAQAVSAGGKVQRSGRKPRGFFYSGLFESQRWLAAQARRALFMPHTHVRLPAHVVGEAIVPIPSGKGLGLANGHLHALPPSLQGPRVYTQLNRRGPDAWGG